MSKAGLRVLVTADAVGGVWQYSLELARGLAPLGIETILAVVGPSPERAQIKAAESIQGLSLVDTGLPLPWLATSAVPIRKAGEAIADLAQQGCADLVQLNEPALAAEATFGLPVIVVAHNCLSSWWTAVKRTKVDKAHRWRAQLEGKGLSVAQQVVVPSAAFGEALRAAHGLAAVPETVHNGRAPLPLPRVASHDFAFTAGRLWDKAKNVRTLDDAARRLPVPFYAAGPTHGPSGDAMALSHARGLGSLSEKEVAGWLAARPVFVSSAVYEPFGLAVLEAAGAGCPLVLSDVPSFRELWDGAACFVEPMDADGFAQAVTRIIGDDRLRAQMGEEARMRAGRYTPEAMAAKMACLYRRLVGSGSAGSARAAA